MKEMKKFSLISIAIALAVLLACAAFATDPIDYVTDGNGAFDVTYTGTAGAYYAIVVVEGIADEGTAPVITESTIQYIDQATADSNGTVNFEDILLKEDGTQSTVWLGGSDLASAVLLGYVNRETGYDVSGTVTSSVPSKSATVTLTSTSDANKVYSVETENGAYIVTVPADTYQFVVTKDSHLSYTKNALVVADDVIKNVELVVGDIDGSDTVDTFDLVALLRGFGSTGTELAGDFDEDAAVNTFDLVALLRNFGVASTVEN